MPAGSAVLRTRGIAACKIDQPSKLLIPAVNNAFGVPIVVLGI